VCIGEGFAWLEATLILATLLPRWRAELPPDFEPRMDPKVTLRVKGGMPMTLHRR
jgi:cytochrome P450